VTEKFSSQNCMSFLLDFQKICALYWVGEERAHSRGGRTTGAIVRRNGISVAFCALGVTTLCRFLGGVGDLGWKWVNIGGRAGVEKIAMVAGIAKYRRN